uniref:Uncharacterized protein n=1 Tax=Cannabis sativa TaxID=3483 RepID=A0A803R8W6_CANSA
MLPSLTSYINLRVISYQATKAVVCFQPIQVFLLGAESLNHTLRLMQIFVECLLSVSEVCAIRTLRLSIWYFVY